MMAAAVEGPPAKRLRGSKNNELAMDQHQQQTSNRSSILPFPTLKLTGHSGSIQYSPSGNIVQHQF